MGVLLDVALLDLDGIVTLKTEQEYNSDSQRFCIWLEKRLTSNKVSTMKDSYGLIALVSNSQPVVTLEVRLMLLSNYYHPTINDTVTSNKQDCPLFFFFFYNEMERSKDKFSVPQVSLDGLTRPCLALVTLSLKQLCLKNTAGGPESLERPVFLDSNLKPVR